MAYLTLEGLQYFFDKCKEYFAKSEHQHEASQVTDFTETLEETMETKQYQTKEQIESKLVDYLRSDSLQEISTEEIDRLFDDP